MIKANLYALTTERIIAAKFDGIVMARIIRRFIFADSGVSSSALIISQKRFIFNSTLRGILLFVAGAGRDDNGITVGVQASPR